MSGTFLLLVCFSYLRNGNIGLNVGLNDPQGHNLPELSVYQALKKKKKRKEKGRNFGGTVVRT